MTPTMREYRIYRRNQFEFDAEQAEWEDGDKSKTLFTRNIGAAYISLSGAKSAVRRYAAQVNKEIGRFQWKQAGEDYWTAEGLIL